MFDNAYNSAQTAILMVIFYLSELATKFFLCNFLSVLVTCMCFFIHVCWVIFNKVGVTKICRLGLRDMKLILISKVNTYTNTMSQTSTLCPEKKYTQHNVPQKCEI